LVPLAGVSIDMLEKNPSGAVPIISSDGKKSWRYYGKPYERKGHLPMIAILITGLGQNKGATASAIKLPENISLSFSPYARDVSGWANSARTAGHELFLDLPMEPNNYPASDPGPYGLLAGNDAHENILRLQWLMARFTGFAGFVTPQNEVFTANDEAFKQLLQALGGRGLMLTLVHEPIRAETKQLLSTSPTASSIGDVLIDEELSVTAIQTRLLGLEKLATKRGFAVGIAQAYPLSLKELDQWSRGLEEKGFVLVPLTFTTKLKFTN
jgi:polysaccharide deacetylase 2 family uncharacterized protein YibQ